MEYIRSLNQFQITVQVKTSRVTPPVSVQPLRRVMYTDQSMHGLIVSSALPVRAGDQDAGAAQPLLHAAPVPAVPRPQRLQTTGESGLRRPPASHPIRLMTHKLHSQTSVEVLLFWTHFS